MDSLGGRTGPSGELYRLGMEQCELCRVGVDHWEVGICGTPLVQLPLQGRNWTIGSCVG